MTQKILLVDDEPKLLRSISRHYRKKFDVSTAESGAEALEIVEKQGPFAVVISDMNMPEMNGVEFLGQLRDQAPDTVRIMLTGNADQATPINAINEGHIFRFFNKPVPLEVLEHGIKEGLRQYELITAEKVLLEKTLAGSVKVLMDVLSIADPHAFGKASKVQQWAEEIAKGLRLHNPWEIKISAMLANLGRVAVPKDIIQKLNASSPLSEDEQEIVQTIPDVGKSLIINVPRLHDVAQNVHYQNKNFDGSGYPEDSLTGDNIPIGARLLRILKDLAEYTEGNLPSADNIAQLDRWPERYDPELKRKVQGYFEYRLKKLGDAPKTELKKMKVAHLLAGYTVHSDIETEDGLLVLASGAKLTTAQIQRLQNLTKVYVFKEPILADTTTRDGAAND